MITFVTTTKFIMFIDRLNSYYSLVKSPELFGRYITNSHIEKCLTKYSQEDISVVGKSAENRPIYALKFGNGPKKVLLWSQMHGNESTTTKALFDCFALFVTNNDIPNDILSNCTLFVIPILNPDGAERYTRLNACGVDLNRDAQNLSQPESVVLRSVFNTFKPDYCFNLHGQRTIYNVGTTNTSSVLSFLAPSQDKKRSITSTRKVAMSIISQINKSLQGQILGGVARYDDGFNLNCVGDTFQSFNVPTILYEAGHYPKDYNREVVRKLMFFSILKGLKVIADGVDPSVSDDYFSIPENGTLFYDILIRNVTVKALNNSVQDIGILYKEALINGYIEFMPVVEAISNLKACHGHREIDAKGKNVFTKENSEIKVGNEIDFVLLNNEKISLKL
ncbi:M14 family zinc carboxypeptidase [uncultured Winogradskyella sp.]|uniref:M14 family zinc carboxypeptidase n=1 Tax=uncultured Winogradskyella sp. TaxID=395353 RepID=UPI00261BE45D|nr:M14 family zinc carboxypeptidase [uncultured Winogradskyella sp.]